MCDGTRKCLDDFSSHNNICILSRNRRGLKFIESLLCAGYHSQSQLEEELLFQYCGFGN